MFPAPAGMSPDILARNRQALDVPRTRGDEPAEYDALREPGACSPHPRG